MRAMLLTLLALTLPALANISPVRKPSPAPPNIVDVNARLESKGKHKGAWYMSADGHAIFCYGPTTYIQIGTDIQKVATFCRGDKVIVPLHD